MKRVKCPSKIKFTSSPLRERSATKAWTSSPINIQGCKLVSEKFKQEKEEVQGNSKGVRYLDGYNSIGNISVKNCPNRQVLGNSKYSPLKSIKETNSKLSKLNKENMILLANKISSTSVNTPLSSYKNNMNLCNMKIMSEYNEKTVVLAKLNTSASIKQIKTNDLKEDSEYFSNCNEKSVELSNEEKSIYGNRQLKNYTKKKLLGKGGCGIVWLAVDTMGNEYALKQVSKKNRIDATQAASIARKEIEVLSFLNNQDTKDPIIVNLYYHYEDLNDIWLVCEKGGRSLSSLTMKIQGEFINHSRIYSIKKGKFLGYLLSDMKQFKTFIATMLRFIDFLSVNGIVHGDVKPDNILIDFDNEDEDKDKESRMKSIKVIDFGSAFFLSNPENFSSNTPEYMSPEITELLEKNMPARDFTNFLKKLCQWPWCIDMWSLGVTILEMVLSCPLWMSYKAKVVIHGKTIFKTGLFGVQGRKGSKIHSKQIDVSNSITKLLQESLISDEVERQQLGNLLSQMLDINYKTRISPHDALSHPFFI